MSGDSTPLLGVNVDHVATLRQARGTLYPEPVQAALEAEQAGADLITIHLREDRRHILDRDVTLIAQVLQTRLNLEMAVTDEMLSIAEGVVPADVCLVPERREELTTEGGLDVAGQVPRIAAACERLHAVGTRVSLFIDPDVAQLEATVEAGARIVELHTGCFAEASDPQTRDRELARIREATDHGLSLGLQINAGHGLHYHNVQEVARIEGIREFNIGHSIIARAIFVGLADAVGEMKRLLLEARR